MKILLDQGMNPRLRNFLSGHETRHAFHLGWHDFKDSLLLDTAEREGFDVLITTDRMKDRQPDPKRRIALVVLSGNRTDLIRAAHERIRSAVEQAVPGSRVYIDLRAKH